MYRNVKEKRIIVHMCEFCGFKTDSKSHLARHLKIRHDANLLKPEYKCDVCEYTSLNQAHVKRHRIAKHGGERFRCDLCDLTFSIKDSVARHKDIVHKNVLYPCAECDFVAKRLDSLKNHSLKHFESMLACEKCDVKVRTNRRIPIKTPASWIHFWLKILSPNTIRIKGMP